MFPKLLPDEVYQIDDGTAEISIGLTYGGDFICLNEFAVIPGSETITTINIAWGTPSDPDASLNGMPYTVVLWDDPNGDGQPDDATVLTTASDVVANEGTDTFIHTPITPTTVTTSNCFVGFLLPNTAVGQFPSAFDETDPSLLDRSFTAFGTAGTGNIDDLTDNEYPVATIESYGLAGNWLIRAEGPLGLESAFSEKNGWDIDLPLNGSGVEGRSGGSDHEYALYFVFTTPLASVAGASTSCGSVASFEVDPDNANQAEVDLTGMDCDASFITVTASGLVDTLGNTLASASITFGLLNGDVNGDGAVNRKDYHEVKDHLGQPVNRHNFRADVSANNPSHIDLSDLRLVRRELGTRLP